MKLYFKRLFLNSFTKTLSHRDIKYHSFYPDMPLEEELELLFKRMESCYGKTHFPVYRLCDAEYMYLLGRRMPLFPMSLKKKISFRIKSLLIGLNIINQKTWHGENYSVAQKKSLKNKYISDVTDIAQKGYLAPHLLQSEARFCEEYNDGIVAYFHKNNIAFGKENHFPFYFVYLILSLRQYKQLLFEGKSVLIVTALNERKQKINFERELAKEGVTKVFFYEISPSKSMLEVIDKAKLPDKVDLVLLGAGVGSANIMYQLSHLNAVCIDSGHALDCFSQPDLRKEKICLLPDEMIDYLV